MIQLNSAEYEELFERINQSNLSKKDKKTVVALLKDTNEFIMADAFSNLF